RQCRDTALASFVPRAATHNALPLLRRWRPRVNLSPLSLSLTAIAHPLAPHLIVANFSPHHATADATIVAVISQHLALVTTSTQYSSLGVGSALHKKAARVLRASHTHLLTPANGRSHEQITQHSHD